MRSSARRSVAASTWLRAEMPTQCGPSGRRPGPASRPAKPSGTSRALRQQVQAGLPRVAAALHKAHTPPTGSTPSAGQDGQGEGGVGQPLRLQRTTHACAFKTRGGSLGLRTYSMTSGATRLSKLVGCALSQRLLAVAVAAQRLQSLHAARKGLPHSAPRGPARRPSARSRTARTCLPLRRAGHLPLCLQQLQENLVRQAARRWPVLLVELRRAADGHLGALAGGHELAPRLPQVLAPEQARESAHTSSTLSCSSSASCHAERLVLEGARQHVLLAGRKLTLLRPLMRWRAFVFLNLSGFMQQRPKMAFWVSFTTFSATTLPAVLSCLRSLCLSSMKPAMKGLQAKR